MFGFLRPKPIKLIHEALDQLEHDWALSMFSLVRGHVDRLIDTHKATIITSIQSGECTPMQVAVAQVANVSGDLLESGTLHVYRGILSPAGEAVMAIFRRSLEEMVAKGNATESEAAEQISSVLSSIRMAG
jgi:hypothetical protein